MGLAAKEVIYLCFWDTTDSAPIRANPRIMPDRDSTALGHICPAAFINRAKSSSLILIDTDRLRLGVSHHHPDEPFSLQGLLCTRRTQSVLESCVMQEYALFVRLLAERMYSAKLSTGPIRDASDFHAWLVKVSEIAERSETLEEFLKRTLD